MSNSENNTLVGTITEALPNTLFRVEVLDTSAESGIKSILSYLSGKMRIHRIKVLVGDKVEVLIDKYGGKGRIIRRI